MAGDREFWDQLIGERGSRAFDTLEAKAASDKAEREVDIFLLARMHGVTRGRILEIGCGRGRMTRVLAELFETVVALDVSREATRRCRGAVEASNVLVVLGDDQTVAGMPNGAFDVVFSYATFQHVSSRLALKSYIASAARLPAPAGIALLQLRHPGWKARVVDSVAFARRLAAHNSWSRSWRGQVLDAAEIERIVLSARPGAGVKIFPGAFVAGIPRHMWVEIRA